jgi:hypothetical protein
MHNKLLRALFAEPGAWRMVGGSHPPETAAAPALAIARG